MAKHEILIHENTGATKESAPYLGTYVSKDTIKTDTFAATLAEMSGLPAIQAQAILAGSFDAIESLEKESLVRMHLDGFCVSGVIFGQFPTADAAFDPATNSLELAMRLDDEVKLELADVTPTIVTDETVTKVRVDHVIDEAMPRPYELIHGRHVFQVTGLNLVITDVGATVLLTNNLGVTFPCTVVQAVSKQVLRVRSTALLEAGDYKLVVKSRGGDAEGPLQAVFRNVKYLKIDDLPRFTGTDPTGEIPATADGSLAILGANLADFLDPAKLEASELSFVADTFKVGEDLYRRNVNTAEDFDFAASTASRLVIKTGGFYGDVGTYAPGEAITGKLIATMNDEVLSVDCTLKMPGNPKIRISNFTAKKVDAGTLLNLGIAHPEAVVGYTPGESGPEGAKVTAKLSFNDSTPFDQDIVQADEGEWGIIIPTEVVHAEPGDNVKLTLERDPAKTQFDPTAAEETVIITAE